MFEIKIRPINWQDLIPIYRHRGNTILFDNEYKLTRGDPVSFSSILSFLDPSCSRYAGIQESNSSKASFIGQLRQSGSDKTAKLSYIIHFDNANPKTLAKFIDGLVKEKGSQGLCAIVLEIEENSPYFEEFRQCGFSVYGWQRIWKFDVSKKTDFHYPSFWESSSQQHEIEIHNLHQYLVPAIVQRAEYIYQSKHTGLIYKKNNEILAFIKDSYGPEGIYLSGLIHPDVDNTVLLLQSLFNCFPNLPQRPIYLEVRSYQSGIENSLELLNCLPGPRQALMVKHIASLSNTKELSLTRKVLEKVRAEPTAPIIHHFITDNKKN